MLAWLVDPPIGPVTIHPVKPVAPTIQGEQEFPVVGATGLTGWTVTAPIGGSTQFPVSFQH